MARWIGNTRALTFRRTVIMDLGLILFRLDFISSDRQMWVGRQYIHTYTDIYHKENNPVVINDANKLYKYTYIDRKCVFQERMQQVLDENQAKATMTRLRHLHHRLQRTRPFLPCPDPFQEHCSRLSLLVVTTPCSVTFRYAKADATLVQQIDFPPPSVHVSIFVLLVARGQFSRPRVHD